MLKALVIFAAVSMVHSVPLLEDPQCGYESCQKTEEGILNVHIVPHTHDDVGWLKTVDQYYYGSRNSIQKAGVQYILDSVIKELWEDPKRRFIYVETAFLWKWWVRQSEATQSKVRTLVAEGRLQLVGGAWSMNDEAASHYQSTVDQFTWGLRKLNQTFGPCALPRVGWQIDPFGHSREFASILAGMGYDGLFLGRIDYQDKRLRMTEQNMEMIWRGDDDLGESSDLFTGVLYNTYSPPPGFCFDVLCSDEPIIDDPDSPMYNVEQKIAIFLEYVKIQSWHYRTKNVIVTMGGDFTYQDATMWYTNLDKLIEYSNIKAAKDGLNIKLFYSTPNCYLKAVRDANPTLPTKQDDFFPYASDSTAYWTGYFTSRPTTKYFEREANNYLQMVKQLQVLAGLDAHNIFVLNELKSAMGIMQHHDAITGTEKEHVTHDYERILNQAIDDSLLIARQAFTKILEGDALKPPVLSYDRCHLNESSCHTSENSDNFVVTIYNALAWPVDEIIRIPVKIGNYEVYAPNGDKITSQLVKLPQKVIDIPTRKPGATHELFFLAKLHPVGIKSFYVKKSNRNKRDAQNNKNYYDNIDEYWKDVREKPFVDIKKLEDAPMYNNDLDKSYIDQIPIRPTKTKQVNTVKDFNMDVLKGNMDLKEIERVFNDETIGITNEQRRPKEIASKYDYPSMNEEEMRMLANDPRVVERFDDDLVVFGKGGMKLIINKTTNEIKEIVPPSNDRSNQSAMNFGVHIYYYPGCVGDNRKPENRSSGAYIFRPNATKPFPVKTNKAEQISGDIVQELRFELENGLSIVRQYTDLPYIEHEWLIGPIDISDDVGKEYIVRYETNMINNGVFYTDSNGRQLLKRKLNKRPQWNLSLAEPIAGNYYPVTNEILIESDDKKLSVLTDRSEGGSSIVKGTVELMLHRRLLHDDAFGVEEALNETANHQGLVARGVHRIFVGQNLDLKREVLQMHLRPIVFVSDAKDYSYDQWMQANKAHSWLNQLPEGLHLLTLEPWDEGSVLLRLENYLEKSNNSTLSVDITKILKNIEVKGYKETTLSGNILPQNHKKWMWKRQNDFSDSFNKAYGSWGEKHETRYVDDIAVSGNEIQLKAKQIRTFVIEYQYVA